MTDVAYMVDVPEPHGDEVGHVGEVSRDLKHVVLCPQYVLLYDQVKVS